MFIQSLWALAAAALFSCVALFVKMSAGHFGTMELVFYRSLFGLLFIAFYAYSHQLTVRTAHLAGHIKRSVMGTFSVMLWFACIGLIPLSTCVTLTYTTPLFMSVNFLIIAFLRHKKAPWGLIGTIVLGFTGVTTTLQPSFGSADFLPGLVCLFIALIDLVVYWQIRELGQMHEPSWRIVFYFTTFGTVMGLIGTLFSPGQFHSITYENGLLLLAMGICATLAQLCTTRSYAAGNMLLSSCLGFSAIPFSAILSYLVFDDRFSLSSLFGMLLITVAGVVATVLTKRDEQKKEPAR